MARYMIEYAKNQKLKNIGENRGFVLFSSDVKNIELAKLLKGAGGITYRYGGNIDKLKVDHEYEKSKLFLGYLVWDNDKQNWKFNFTRIEKEVPYGDNGFYDYTEWFDNPESEWNYITKFSEVTFPLTKSLQTFIPYLGEYLVEIEKKEGNKELLPTFNIDITKDVIKPKRSGVECQKDLDSEEKYPKMSLEQARKKLRSEKIDKLIIRFDSSENPKDQKYDICLYLF
jgi:hypothetical protein